MKFTLDAGGAQEAGQGLGSIFKAYMLGPQMRQQAEQDAMKGAADLYHRQMQGNAFAAQARQHDADADLKKQQLSFQQNPLENAMTELGLPTGLAPAFRQRLETGSFGPSYEPPADGMGPTQAAPADSDTVAKLGRTLALVQRMYGTGSNVAQGAEAGLKEQQMRQIDAVQSNPALASAVGTAQAAGHGKPLFNPTGNTGQSVQVMTGESGPVNAVLAKLFQLGEHAQINQRNAAASASNASAGKYSAEADIERQKSDRLRTTGSLPGTGAEGSEGALSGTILRTLQIPELDGKGKPVRNPITGVLETTTDQDALKSFYGWAAGNSRKPTATAFAQWESQGRPSGNKNPLTTQAAPKIEAQAAASSALTKAREALAKGAPRDKVIERLRQNGIDPTGL